MSKKEFIVQAHWDADAKVWWADSDDIPGLVTEAETFDALVERVVAIAPELLSLNGVKSTGELPVHVMADRVEQVRLRS